MKVKVCLVQDAPEFFELQPTIAKIEKHVKENSEKGCELIVFPESFLPAYPRGLDFGMVVGNRSKEGRKLFQLYHDNCLLINGAEHQQLEKIASDNKVYLIMGATIKYQDKGSLYCATLYIDPEKGTQHIHRKIKPTGTERSIWAEGDATDLKAVDASLGKLGGLICWENYMPLARMSQYEQGVELYIAPTADSRPEWQATMQHIALEGRCFVLACNQFARKSMYQKKIQAITHPETPEEFCRGGSVIISPLGKVIAGPVYDQAASIIAEIDTDEITQARLDMDVNGHYSRKDIFNFNWRM